MDPVTNISQGTNNNYNYCKWSNRSYKLLTFHEKMEYSICCILLKIQSVLNVLRQIWPNCRSLPSFGAADKQCTIHKLRDAWGLEGQRFSQANITCIYNSLRKKPNVQLIDNGYTHNRHDDTCVQSRKPSKVLADETNTNTYANTVKLMPFVFPSLGLFSEAHMVLISVDYKEKQIRYFDPKGAYSDDTKYKGCFQDNLKFDMRQDLETLQDNLMQKDIEAAPNDHKSWELMENTVAYQRDVANCGAYVALAMKDEAEGRQVGQDWETGLSWINKKKIELAASLEGSKS
jgi:hypothetical protein